MLSRRLLLISTGFVFEKYLLYRHNVDVQCFLQYKYVNIFIFLQQNSSVIIIYEITRTKTRHQRIREIGLPVNVQSLQLLSDGRLCVGSPSCFTVYDIQNPDQQLICKLNKNQLVLLLITCFFLLYSSFFLLQHFYIRKIRCTLRQLVVQQRP